MKNGSNWNRWDLHFHTASSYDYGYNGKDSDELIVEALKEEGIKGVVITDHFLIDCNRIRNIMKIIKDKQYDITVFPGVELRTDKGAQNVHVILIFNNDNIEKISKVFDVNMLIKKKEKYNDENIYWDYNEIVKFANENDALISIHAGGKSSGVDSQIKNEEVGMAIKTEYAETVDMFEMGKLNDVESYKTRVFTKIKSRPTIICSDNHDPREYKLKEKQWIKCELTFEGLKQAIIHHDERFFIGDSPPKLLHSEANKTKYIKSVTISKNANAVNSDEWFNFTIPLNKGLTTIIGNKGSGKSALADMMGYIGNTSNNEYYSFLSNKRFCKEDKKYNLDYNGKITWLDNQESNVCDFSLKREIGVPMLRYLPQRYIEETCNNLDAKFQTEINSVIFSYVDIKDRLGATKLEQLIAIKEKTLLELSRNMRVKFTELNERIIKLEDMKTSESVKDVKNKLEHYKSLLQRLENNKPIEVQKPNEDDTHTKNMEILSVIIEARNKVEEELENKRILLSDYTKEYTLLNQLKEEITEKLNEFNEFSNYLIEQNALFELNPKILFNLSFDIKGIEVKIEDLSLKIQQLNSETVDDGVDVKYDDNIAADKIHEDITSELNLQIKLKKFDARISRAKKILSKPYQLYQSYLDKIKIWNEEKVKIIGNEDTVETLQYYEKILNYINGDLDKELEKLYSERIELIKERYNIIQNKRNILDSIYKPVDDKLKLVLENIDEKITFKSKVSFNKLFANDFLSYINQSVTSDFRGKAIGKDLIDTLIRTYDVDVEGQIESFIADIFSKIIKENDKKHTLLNGKVLEFYDLLCNLDYLETVFTLHVGSKELSQLSPGEKGSVLLIFYLALDKDDLPLIIDQPEDNLDNQSVFNKLVPSILEAKKNRQVVLVTHNPNLAIACDSELIISSKKDFEKNEINYTYGSIEDLQVRKEVVDILEGTRPAFDLRKSKYDA